MHRALEKILSKSGVPELADILASGLSNGELTTLLLDVYQRRAAALEPYELYRDLPRNRFVAPAEGDPIRLRRAEAEILEQALSAGFTPVELSPLAPLGSSAVYGLVSQNNVLSALRGCEVVSDPTNAMLPQMLTRLWEEGLPELLWAGSQRVVRSNLLDIPGNQPHFLLFAACSLVRSKDPQILLDAALNHLRLQRAIYAHFGLTAFRLLIRVKGRKKFLADQLLEQLEASGEFDYKRDSASGSGYYEGFQIKSYSGDAELADCGFVDWAARLKGDARLHAFISGIGIERLIGLQP